MGNDDFLPQARTGVRLLEMESQMGLASALRT